MEVPSMTDCRAIENQENGKIRMLQHILSLTRD